MKSIYLHSELDLVHRGNYTPFTLLGVVLFIGIILLFSAVTFRNFLAWITPSYFVLLFATLAYDIILLNKVIPNGNVIFYKVFDRMNVEINIDKNILHSGKIVDFSYWWGNYASSIHGNGEYGDFVTKAGRGNQNLFLEFIYETGQRVILYETTLSWESVPPNWSHKSGHVSLDAMNFPTFKVKEMVDLLSKEFKTVD